MPGVPCAPVRSKFFQAAEALQKLCNATAARLANLEMFELRKTFTFEASHVLTKHDGKCSRLHGHSYSLTVVLRGSSLHSEGPKRNMLIDFGDISAAVKDMIVSHLDHHHLNESLQTDSPTAEYIARWVYRHLAPALPHLARIEVGETASSVAIYRPSRRERRAAFTSKVLLANCPQELTSSIGNGETHFVNGTAAFPERCNGQHAGELRNARECTSSDRDTESDASSSESDSLGFGITRAFEDTTFADPSRLVMQTVKGQDYVKRSQSIKSNNTSNAPPPWVV